MKLGSVNSSNNGDVDAANAENLVARYLRPEPRIELAPVLRAHARAGMDLSDGLVKDLGRMAAASGCGARKAGEVTIASCEAITRPFGTRLCTLTRYPVAACTGAHPICACRSATTAACASMAFGASHTANAAGVAEPRPHPTRTASAACGTDLASRTRGQGTIWLCAPLPLEP